MRLARLYPKVASRPCAECERYWYDDRGELVTRAGKPQSRPKGVLPPCGSCPKVPPGTPKPSPAEARELTDELRQAVQFYRECRAVNSFPDDPIVRWCASVIRAAEDHCDRIQDGRRQLLVLSALKE